MRRRLSSQWMGRWGFAGFYGFRYFISQDSADLFYLSFFAFFAFFVTGKLAKEMPDERLRENSQKAAAKTMYIPAFVLYLIGFLSANGVLEQAGIVLLAALGWAATIVFYAILFYRYEKD